MEAKWQQGLSFSSNLCCSFYRKILGSDWQPKSPLKIFLDHEYFQMIKYITLYGCQSERRRKSFSALSLNTALMQTPVTRVRLSITDYNLSSSRQSAPQNHFILQDILKPLSSGFMQVAKISQLKHCI